MCETWTEINLLNISTAGIAFAGDQQLASGSLRRFRFYLPGNPNRLSLNATIGHSRKHAFLPGFRMGALFANPKEDEASAIRTFIAARLAHERERTPASAQKNGSASGAGDRV